MLIMEQLGRHLGAVTGIKTGIVDHCIQQASRDMRIYLRHGISRGSPSSIRAYTFFEWYAEVSKIGCLFRAWE
jgi:hypothetical protein